MSHDDHGHGHDSGPAKPSNPFFIIGVILFIGFFAVQTRPNTPRPIKNPPVGQPITTTPAVPFTAVSEEGPTYNPNILKSPGTEPGRLKKEPQVASKAPWSYVITFVSRYTPFESWVVGTSYQQKHTIKTVNVGPDARMVEQAAVRLTPNEIQDENMKLITYLQHLTANHKNCHYDEDGGRSHVPDEGVFQPEAIGWNKLRGGAAALQPTMSTGTLPLSGYDFYTTLPDESVTPQNGLPCDSQGEGEDVSLYEMGDNEEIYKGTDHTVWSPENFCSASELAKYDECMAQQAQCTEEDKKAHRAECKKDCKLACGEGAHTVFSTRLPDACKVNKDIGYCPEEGEEPTGFVYTQIPSEFSFNKRDGTNTQDHTLQIPICKGCEITSETSVYYLEALRRQHLEALNCSLQPQELQDPNHPCPTPEPEPTQSEELNCPIDIIAKLPQKDASCKLCNGGAIKSFLTPLEASAIPGGLSPLAIKILETAADTYHVPAAMLTAMMLHEGSFEHPETWTWSNDETIKKFSDCKTQKPMPSCDAFAHPTTGAKGPFGFIDNWWANYMAKEGPYKNLLKDPKLKAEFAKVNTKNISPCNFVDAAFMSARELGEDQSHLYVPGIPTSCPAISGYPATSVYQGGDIPASCGVWSSDRAALARLQYSDRVCDDSVGRTVAMYSAMKCGGK